MNNPIGLAGVTITPRLQEAVNYIWGIGITTREINDLALAKAIADFSVDIPSKDLGDISSYVSNHINPVIEATAEMINELIPSNMTKVVAKAKLICEAIIINSNPILNRPYFNADNMSDWTNGRAPLFTKDELITLGSREAYKLYLGYIKVMEENGRNEDI